MVSSRAAASISILMSTVIVGTVGFHYLERDQGLSWVDSIYFTVVTITTVGYGEIHPQTDLGRLFAIPVIVVGVSAALSSLTFLFGSLLEERLRRAVLGLSRPVDHKNHVILCGRGPLADVVAKELRLNHVPFVRVIREPDPAIGEALVGDPSEESTLLKAGIRRALSIVAMLDEDADNAFVILEAKRVEPHVRVITVVRDPANRSKMEEIGADLAIASDYLAARLLALSSEKHFSLNFFDRELSSRAITLNEISVPESSAVVGKTLAELEIPKKFGVSVIAISQGTRLTPNPDPAVAVEAGAQVIVFGEKSKALELQFHLSGKEGEAARFAAPPPPDRKPLAHEIRVRAPRIVTNLFLIGIVVLVNQFASPIFAAAGLTLGLQSAFSLAIFTIVWAAIGYLLLQILSDLKVLVDLGVLRALGLEELLGPGGRRRVLRNTVFIALVVILGVVVSPVLGSWGGLAAWVGHAVPWVCLGLILVVLYDVGSFLHPAIVGWVGSFTEAFAKGIEEER